MKYFFLSLTLFFSIITSAQQDLLNITVSKVFSNEKYKTSLLFAKEDTNGDIFAVRNYYASQGNPKGYYIEHYDKDLKLLERTTIDVNRNEIKGLFLNEKSVVLLQFQYIQKEKKYAFATLTSSKNKFNFQEKEIYAIDRNRIDKYDHFGIRSEPEFNKFRNNNLGEITESENGKLIAINLFSKTKKSDILRVITFNNNFDKIYEHEFENITTDQEEKNNLPLEYQNMILDNDGSVYLLARIFNSSNTNYEKNDAPNYRFILFKGDKISQSQKILPVESNNIIVSLQLVSLKDKLAAVGIYTDPADTKFFAINNGYPFNGIVRLNLNKTTLEMDNESFDPFSEEFMMDKYGKVKEKIKATLSFRKMFMTPNGDVVFNAEETEIYIPERSTQSRKTYKDIISCRISEGGKMVWARNINKFQQAWQLDNIMFFSYTATFKNDVFYYLVNSGELKTLENNRKELSEGSQLYTIKIDEHGDISYIKDTHSNIFNAQLAVRFGVLINKADMLFEAESNNKPLMVKIKI